MIRWKNILFTLIQLCLWLTFVLAVADAGALGVRPAGSPFTAIGFLVSPLYAVAGALIQPAAWLTQVIGVFHPDAPNIFFPFMTSSGWHQSFAGSSVTAPLASLSYPGAIIWLIPIASILYALVSRALDYVIENARNWVWNLVIEYGFQRKKHKLYEEALNQRQQDLTILNSQLRALEQETDTLKDSVITDELTKVYNKRFFLTRLQQEFENAKREKHPLALIMIDIDFFKKLNDTYGHLSGDKVLIAVAEVIKNCALEHTFPCRYGGEEFAIIMPRTNPREASEVANRIQQNIQSLRFEAVDKKLKITVSQGICSANFMRTYSQAMKHFDEILELADQQLYRSKMEGRNRISLNNLN